MAFYKQACDERIAAIRQEVASRESEWADDFTILVEALDEQAVQLKQARRWATDLEAQLCLATELRIPVPGGFGAVLLIRREPGVDAWAVRDIRRPHDYWVDGRWQDMPRQVSLHDCFPHPLHEAFDIGQKLANGGVS